MKRLSVLIVVAIALTAVSTVDAQENQVIGIAEPASQWVQEPVYRPYKRRFFRRGSTPRPRYTQADRIRDVRTEQFAQRYPHFIGGFITAISPMLESPPETLVFVATAFTGRRGKLGVGTSSSLPIKGRIDGRLLRIGSPFR